MRFSLLVLSLLVLPRVSSAAAFCEPLDKLRARVNYCDENPSYVAPAKACLETFRKLVKAKNEEIDKVLKAVVANRKGEEQAENFKTTQALLASADLTLVQLLLHGKTVYNEIEDYTEDFVLPIFEAYPEDYELDPHSKKAQEIFREKECYGEPMSDFDKMKKDLLAKIDALERTKAEVNGLQLKSNAKEADLKSLTTSSAGGVSANGGPAASALSGNKPRKSSTITGVDEEKRKKAEQ